MGIYRRVEMTIDRPITAPTLSAIAYVKEAIRTWKKVDSPEAVFVKACKSGRKPDNWGKPKVNHPQPTPEQLAQLAAAKSRREILDLYQQPDGLWVADTGQAVIAGVGVNSRCCRELTAVNNISKATALVVAQVLDIHITSLQLKLW